MSVKSTTEEFIQKAIKLHRDVYDYSQVEYKDNHTKVKIICKEHGIFEQIPNSHLNNRGCPKCGKIKRGDLNRTPLSIFIEKSNIAHSDKYDYSLMRDYKSLDEKLTIICPIHGKFEQNGNSHIRGMGCEKCSYVLRGEDRIIFTKEFMIEEFFKLDTGFTYDFSNYKTSRSIISYVCPIHGKVFQKAIGHLRSKCCKHCSNGGRERKSTTEEFIKKASKIHNNLYDYSKVIYDKNYKKVEIFCKYHGSFFQKPNAHLSGSGCPTCSIIISNAGKLANVFEESKNITCYLYLFKISNDNEEFFKVGITKSLINRIKSLKTDCNNNYNIEALVISKTNIFTAVKFEQGILKIFKSYKYKPLIYFGGQTECLSKYVPLKKLIKYFSLKNLHL